MSELLDQWERDFKKSETVSLKRWREISIALIELVRKKDEAFKTIKRFRPDRKALAENPFESDVELISALASALEVCSDECDGALSLTDQLGGSGD